MFFKSTLVLALVTLASANFKSPCPEVFNAETVKKSEGKWEGVLHLDSEFDLAGLWIRVHFDKKVQNVAHESAEVVTEDHQSWLFRMPNSTLEAGKKVKVPFAVKYDEKEGVPNLIQIRLNAREICPEKKEPVQISPCPAIFKYTNVEKKEEGRWHGELHLDSEFTLNGVWIRVYLDKQGKILPNGFGEVEPRDHNSFLIRDKHTIIKPGSTLKVPFIVAYEDKNAIPNIDKVRLNARTVCENKLVLPTSAKVTEVVGKKLETPAVVAEKKEENKPTTPKVEEKKPEKKEEKPVVADKKEDKVVDKKDEKVSEKTEDKHDKKDEKEVPTRAHLDNAHHHPHAQH